MHFMCCCMPKGTSQGKATSNNKKIKLIASSYEDISQLVSQSVENSIK